jgi:hypothetical protein
MGKIVVTYSAGYEQFADVPPALQQACLQLVSSYNQTLDRDPLLRATTADGLGSKEYYSAASFDVISPEVRGLLNQFRRLVIA